MVNIIGKLEGQPGPVVDTTVVEPNDYPAGTKYASPVNFTVPGKYKNLGNVTQTLELTAVNLTSNINSATLNLGGTGTNTVTLAPGEEASVSVTLDVTLPATPTQIDAPAVREDFNVDLDSTWTVV